MNWSVNRLYTAISYRRFRAVLVKQNCQHSFKSSFGKLYHDYDYQHESGRTSHVISQYSSSHCSVEMYGQWWPLASDGIPAELFRLNNLSVVNRSSWSKCKHSPIGRHSSWSSWRRCRPIPDKHTTRHHNVGVTQWRPQIKTMTATNHDDQLQRRTYCWGNRGIRLG